MIIFLDMKVVITFLQALHALPRLFEMTQSEERRGEEASEINSEINGDFEAEIDDADNEKTVRDSLNITENSLSNFPEGQEGLDAASFGFGDNPANEEQQSLFSFGEASPASPLMQDEYANGLNEGGIVARKRKRLVQVDQQTMLPREEIKRRARAKYAREFVRMRAEETDEQDGIKICFVYLWQIFCFALSFIIQFGINVNFLILCLFYVYFT